MRLYDFKRGHRKSLEEIAGIMEELFGGVKREGEHLVASFGTLERIEVWLEGSKMAATTSARREGDAQKTLKRWNEFLYRVTGYTAKERKKKMTKV